MSRCLVILDGPAAREKVMRWIPRLPKNTRVEIKAPKRSLPQNDRLWAMLTDISEQVEWHGMRLSPSDWKVVLTAGLRREIRVVPGLDGKSFVALGLSTSDMSKEDFSALLELAGWFAADKGVILHDQREVAA